MRKYKIPNGAKITSVGKVEEKHHGWTRTGLVIETTKGDIKLMICDSACCSENFGKFFFNTIIDKDKFIGKTIKIVEDTREKLDHILGTNADRKEIQLRIVTSGETIQYVVYNSDIEGCPHATLKQIFDVVENGSV